MHVSNVLPDEHDDKAGVSPEKQIRDKIIHILTVYPRISVSMMQIGVGTSLAPTIWKPVLEQLIREGVIIRDSKSYNTPAGREQIYTILSLKSEA